MPTHILSSFCRLLPCIREVPVQRHVPVQGRPCARKSLLDAGEPVFHRMINARHNLSGDEAKNSDRVTTLAIIFSCGNEGGRMRPPYTRRIYCCSGAPCCS